MTKAELAQRVVEVALRRGEFKLRSGQISNVYFDKYQFEAQPALLADVAAAMAPLVPAGTEVLAGLELGGIPIVTMLSQVTGIPAVFVRKQAKDYGTCRLAEGGDIDGRRVVVVEDVVTTGKSTLETAALATAAGAVVTGIGAIIDRSGGRHGFAVPFGALLSLELPTWPAGECPLCAAGGAPVKPGSRPTGAR